MKEILKRLILSLLPVIIDAVEEIVKDWLENSRKQLENAPHDN